MSHPAMDISAPNRNAKEHEKLTGSCLDITSFTALSIGSG